MTETISTANATIEGQTDLITQIEEAVNNLPEAGGGSGTLNITANGTYDVSAYGTAIVAVKSGGGDNIAGLIDGTITSLVNSNVTRVKNYACYSCKSLTTVNLPNVISVAGNAFDDCSALVNVSIPKIQQIYGWAFRGCSSLVSITLPASLTALQKNAFGNCTKLTTVKIEASTPPTLGVSVFQNCSALTQIIVPTGCGNAYKAATNWSEYAALIAEE